MIPRKAADQIGAYLILVRFLLAVNDLMMVYNPGPPLPAVRASRS